MRKSDSIFYSACLIIATSMFYFVGQAMVSVEAKAVLSHNQTQEIVNQIGVKALEKLKLYHCESSLVNYINTGVWSDSWCYSKYQHIHYNLIAREDYE